MKRLLMGLSFIAVLGFATPAVTQTTRTVTNEAELQKLKDDIAKQNKSEGVFVRIGSFIGVGLIIWFIISRFTKKKKD